MKISMYKQLTKYAKSSCQKSEKNINNNINSVTNDATKKVATIRYHKDMGGIVPFGEFPKDYTELVSKEFIKGVPEKHIKYSTVETTIPAIPPHWKHTYKFKPHYKIDTIFSTGKGSGTEAIKKVLRESLADNETCGRVIVDAQCIDGYSYPAGFYYKLGFRFPNKKRNDELKQWINNGSNKRYAPTMTGTMYLSHENIEHCLNYGADKK